MFDKHRNPPLIFKRRLALKAVVGSVLAGELLNKLPNQWQRPLVKAGALPAHARTSLPPLTPSPVTALSDWTFNLNTITLYHTPGLREMAMSGSHHILQPEYGNIGISGANITIPSGLGDDFENIGYAPIVEYDGYRIAMYHPSQDYPDNWIIYHAPTRRWWRFDLGNDGLRRSGSITERLRST